MKRIVLTLALLIGVVLLSNSNFQISTLHAQCPLFRMKAMLEEHCPRFTTDTTSLHAHMRSDNGREYTINYRALRMEAPRRAVPAHVIRQLQTQVGASMKVATRANHYEVHEDGRDTVSYTLSHGNLRALLRSPQPNAVQRDTIWSASLVLTRDSVRFLSLSTWNARIKNK
ncbi:MAG: hypothetical protein IJT19_01940 [Bacteroidaceae bacterium]|nr:hypothetical protein [Bacteroidaceae bacterium]